MAGIKGDDDMSSSAHNAGSRLLRGEEDLFNWGLVSMGWWGEVICGFQLGRAARHY